MSTTLWTRSWRYKTKPVKAKKDKPAKPSARRVHVEVRDPDQNLVFVKAYRGKDHTFHVILEEGPIPKPKKQSKTKTKKENTSGTPTASAGQ